MDHQEKLHLPWAEVEKEPPLFMTLQLITPPFVRVTVSGEQQFVPLAMDKPMSINDILLSHPRKLFCSFVGWL